MVRACFAASYGVQTSKSINTRRTINISREDDWLTAFLSFLWSLRYRLLCFRVFFDIWVARGLEARSWLKLPYTSVQDWESIWVPLVVVKARSWSAEIWPGLDAKVLLCGYLLGFIIFSQYDIRPGFRLQDLAGDGRVVGLEIFVRDRGTWFQPFNFESLYGPLWMVP